MLIKAKGFHPSPFFLLRDLAVPAVEFTSYTQRNTGMDESEFNQRVDDILVQIEDAIEDSGADIDYETAGGVLTLSFEDDSKIIINRQTPVRQIWVATRQGGFHFVYNDDMDQWQLERDEQNLFAALSQFCSDQAGKPIELSGT
jgi:CyaY protein